MDSILFLIAQFLSPYARGLDIVATEKPCKDFFFVHPIGIYILKLDGDRLTVELAFRSSRIRVAGDYLEEIRNALGRGIPKDENTELHFELERHQHTGYDSVTNTDFHASIYRLSEVSTNAISEDLQAADIEVEDEAA